MADTANRSRGSGRRVRGAFAPDVRCGYRNPTLSSILATQVPCRSRRSGAQAVRRELCGVALSDLGHFRSSFLFYTLFMPCSRSVYSGAVIHSVYGLSTLKLLKTLLKVWKTFPHCTCLWSKTFGKPRGNTKHRCGKLSPPPPSDKRTVALPRGKCYNKLVYL